MEAVKPIPVAASDVAIGIPADTLRQRPDVRAAERSLAASVEQIGIAKAQLYPGLSIGGSVSSNATSIGNLFDMISGQMFANLAQTIFDGGRLRSQVRSNEAGAEAAFAAYKGTVLTSSSEEQTSEIPS